MYRFRSKRAKVVHVASRYRKGKSEKLKDATFSLCGNWYTNCVAIDDCSDITCKECDRLAKPFTRVRTLRRIRYFMESYGVIGPPFLGLTHVTSFAEKSDWIMQRSLELPETRPFFVFVATPMLTNLLEALKKLEGHEMAVDQGGVVHKVRGRFGRAGSAYACGGNRHIQRRDGVAIDMTASTVEDILLAAQMEEAKGPVTCMACLSQDY